MRASARTLVTNVRDHSKNEKGVQYRAEYSRMWKDWLESWREALNPANTTSDLLAGLTVAAIALPLNLALAVASGLPPSVGLIAGAIGGGVTALFGGAKFQVTGPAAALNVMVLLIAQEFGPSGAAAAALGAGVIALTLSFLLAGKLARYVPEAVLAGFTTGVGLKLLDQQIPELLGFNYKVTELANMMHRPVWLHEVSWLAVVCGLFVALLVISTRQFKRFPAALVGVSIVTTLSVYLDWPIERVGEIPSILPTATLPLVPDAQWLPLLMKIIPLGLLGAAESLLSAQVLDRMTPQSKPHNSNLELLGQGLGNLASGLFGGMPVTGVVVRSSANVQSGAKTRLSSLIHGAILLFSVLYLSDQLAKIPLAGLAGLLCVIGLRLIEAKELVHLIKEKKVLAASFLITLVGTVTGHLVEGLLGGMGVALAYQYFEKRNSPNLESGDEIAALRAKGIRAELGLAHASARKPIGYSPISATRTWLSHVSGKPVSAPSAFVHPDATVIGKVVLGEHVHVAADTSIRADEGTPFFIGANSNVQDGVVLHALKEKHVRVGGESWAIFVGKNVSLAHQALVHGPCYIGDNTFVGFKAVVHDSIVGSNCYIGVGAVVIGVEVPDGRFVPHGFIVDTAEKAESLPPATHAHAHFNEDVVEVNRGLAAAYRIHHPESKTTDTLEPSTNERTTHEFNVRF